ncbi:hypothetical protein TWF679_010891 [Orbilia oligospora]|uniref:Major facilitator superfamily (MFS) profile domain-containing protein n=1 Tax=Orbilia oligospora TaxID=2813651 RepID=A0A8H8VID4_ORBOL|nr:hypothetical protein TWF679_010891 [Orbilia oligospora]
MAQRRSTSEDNKDSTFTALTPTESPVEYRNNIEITELTATSKRDLEAARERILRRQALVRQDAPQLPFLTFFRRGLSDEELDRVATQPSVYDDPATAKFFEPHPRWENLHRFDPEARWTWREELPLINRLDWKIMVWACIAFFGLDLGRGNLAQANTDNFLPDLNLTTNDYNLGNTVFQLSFLSAELPSQIISKRIGVDRWLPFLMCSWAIVSGFLTYFYKNTELPFRLAIFWCTRRFTDIVAPIIAFGILRLRGKHGHEGWRWLFLAEGAMMFSIGVFSAFFMPASPTQTKSWYRPNGWFNEREETIIVNRVIRDDPSKGDMHNRQGLTLKLLWKSLGDFDIWPIYIFGMLWELPSGPPDQYLTLNLRNLGFSTFDSNLLSIPSQFFGAITMLILTWLSVSWNERASFGIITQLWYLPNLIALALLRRQSAHHYNWSTFAILTVLLSYPSPHAMHVGWANRNSNSVRTRAVSAALYNMMVQLARVVYSNIYREDDKPECKLTPVLKPLRA